MISPAGQPHRSMLRWSPVRAAGSDAVLTNRSACRQIPVDREKNREFSAFAPFRVVAELKSCRFSGRWPSRFPCMRIGNS